MVSEEGRILIFTGDGKGKTTAALGMALRAHGHGIPVAVIQFVKSDVKTGEFAALSKLPGVEIFVARNLVAEELVLRLLREAAPGVTVVLTGRGATEGLIAAADTVSEIRCVKHGFDIGRKAQKGVEF
jgi:cob(I)alamin adenosyltransferase